MSQLQKKSINNLLTLVKWYIYDRIVYTAKKGIKRGAQCCQGGSTKNFLCSSARKTCTPPYTNTLVRPWFAFLNFS